MRRMRFLLTIPLFLACFSVFAEEAKVLSLQDAILLSLRYNANVRTAELARVSQKFSLEENTEWAFEPQYSLSANAGWTTTRTSSSYQSMTPSWSVTPGVIWQNPIGTKVTIGPATNPSNSSPYNPGVLVTITQNLIQGFGRSAALEVALENAYDTEKVNKLNLKQTIMQQVTATISAYMAVVGAENSVAVDQEAVDRAKTNLFQTNLLIQAGQNAQSDAVQANSQVAQALSQLQTDTSTLIIDRYTLLQTIGLNPDAKIRILHDVPLDKYQLISQDQNVQSALDNNVSYQAAVIGLGATARSVMTAKDTNRPTLNLIEAYSRGGNTGSDVALDNVLNNSAYSSTTSLSLTVPIDNKTNQAAIIDAEIALQSAQLSVKQAKQDLTIQVLSARDSLASSAMQIKLDRDQVNYDKQTLDNTIRSYRAGISSSLQVAQQSQTYANDQRSLVAAQISYFTQFSQFDELYGHTLDTWGIHVQY